MHVFARGGGAILICFDANAHVLFTGRGKLVLVGHKTMHVFVKGRRGWYF